MRALPPAKIASLDYIDHADIDRSFDSPNADQQIEARIRTAYAIAHPGARYSDVEAKVADEKLVFLQAEQRRCFELKGQSDLLSGKHLGKRRTRLTSYVRLNFVLMASTAFTGIGVGTWALAVYAKDSAVMPTLDTSFLAALMLAFPILAMAQATKAVGGSLCKSDAAKDRFYTWLCRLGLVACVSFVASAALAFAPHAIDVESVGEVLEKGAPVANAFVSASKAVAPYVVIGSGLLIEVFGAALIAHRADQMNELGRDVIQGVSPTQLVLDARIESLQGKIDAQAEKAAALQAIADLHEAKVAISIETAQSYARELATQYAAHNATIRRNFIAQHKKGRA